MLFQRGVWSCAAHSARLARFIVNDYALMKLHPSVKLHLCVHNGQEILPVEAVRRPSART